MSFDNCNNNACKRPRSSLSVYCHACLAAVAADEARAKQRADISLAAMFGRPAPETDLDRKAQENMQKACEGRLHEPEAAPAYEDREVAASTGEMETDYGPPMERARQQARDNFARARRQAAKNPLVSGPMRTPAGTYPGYRPAPPASGRMNLDNIGQYLSSELQHLQPGAHAVLRVEAYSGFLATALKLWMPQTGMNSELAAVCLVRISYQGSNIGIEQPQGGRLTPALLYEALRPLPSPVLMGPTHSLDIEIKNLHQNIHAEVGAVVGGEACERSVCG